MGIKINACLKNRTTDDLYKVAVRYYDGSEEKYIITDHRISKDDWNAKKQLPEVIALKNELNDKIKSCVEKCDGAVSFQRFKSAWDGKKLKDECTLIHLLDKHLELNRQGLVGGNNGNCEAYSPSTLKLYAYTREQLVRVESGVEEKNIEPMSIACENFDTALAFKQLENRIKQVAQRKIGKTVLSMHMQNIKAICETGYNPELSLNWIPNDAYSRYSKPTREEGTDPVDETDFMRVLSFNPHSELVHAKGTRDHLKRYIADSMKWAIDFWCGMVYAGGMEARDICKLEWRDFDFNSESFRFWRSKTEDAQDVQIVIAYGELPHWKYLLETYAIKGGRYVFPILNETMNEAEKEKTIQATFSRITKKMGKLSEILGLPNTATCKRARPTFACMAHNHGVDIRTIQQSMGHKKLSTTEIYLKRLPLKSHVIKAREGAAKMPYRTLMKVA